MQPIYAERIRERAGDGERGRNENRWRRIATADIQNADRKSAVDLVDSTDHKHTWRCDPVKRWRTVVVPVVCQPHQLKRSQIFPSRLKRCQFCASWAQNNAQSGVSVIRRESTNLLKNKDFFHLTGADRTPDPQLRRLLLYPTELRADNVGAGCALSFLKRPATRDEKSFLKVLDDTVMRRGHASCRLLQISADGPGRITPRARAALPCR